MASRMYSPSVAVLTFFGVLSLPIVVAAETPPIEPGDTVVVLRDTHVQAGREKLAPVKAGTELVAGEVRGNWVAASVERDGKRVWGWISSGHLIGDPAIAFARLAVGYESEVQFGEADFRNMDTNGDGTVTMEGFVSGTRLETLMDLNTQLSEKALPVLTSWR